MSNTKRWIKNIRRSEAQAYLEANPGHELGAPQPSARLTADAILTNAWERDPVVGVYADD